MIPVTKGINSRDPAKTRTARQIGQPAAAESDYQ